MDALADPKWRQSLRKPEQRDGPSTVYPFSPNHGVRQQRGEQGVLREGFELCAGGSRHASCGCQTWVSRLLHGVGCFCTGEVNIREELFNNVMSVRDAKLAGESTARVQSQCCLRPVCSVYYLL